MRHITHLPTDILLCIGDFLNNDDEVDDPWDNDRYLFAAVMDHYDMIQHYFQQCENNVHG
jgi:hypothetical protein